VTAAQDTYFIQGYIDGTGRGYGPLKAIALRPNDTELVEQAARHYGLQPTAEVCAALVAIAKSKQKEPLR